VLCNTHSLVIRGKASVYGVDKRRHRLHHSHFFKLKCPRPKTAQRGHLNLDVQTDTGIKIQGRPETFGRPGQVNNLAHLKTDIL